MIPDQSLYMQQISLYRNTLAFGGTRNASDIWAAMTYRMPETMAYYRELEDKDEDVSNALDDLKLSVMSRNITVQPANDKDSAAVDTKEFIEAQLAKVKFDEVLDCVLDAVGYGFSVQEMIFDTSMGQASLLDLNDSPQELFLFGNRYYPQTGPLQLLDNPWAAEGGAVPEQKFLIFSYRKRSRDRMGRPLLKSVFWPSWFKRNMERLWLQFAEKGPGTVVVRYNDPDSPSERKKAVDIAQAIRDNTAIAVPKTFDYDQELLKVARAQNPDVYEHFFRTMQYSIIRRVLGETLTSFGNEGGKGSNAQGQTHSETKDERSVFVAKAVMSVVNDQLVRPLVLWNFGPDAPMPRWDIEIKEGEDLQSALTIVSGVQRLGKKITAGYVAERFQIPLAAGENGELPTDVLVPNINAPSVALRDTTVGFSEAEKESEIELSEFDKLFEQLKAESAAAYKERAKEIAGAAVPVRSTASFADEGHWVEIDDHPVLLDGMGHSLMHRVVAPSKSPMFGHHNPGSRGGPGSKVLRSVWDKEGKVLTHHMLQRDEKGVLKLAGKTSSEEKAESWLKGK
jgi:phage gp29-like protein